MGLREPGVVGLNENGGRAVVRGTRLSMEMECGLVGPGEMSKKKQMTAP